MTTALRRRDPPPEPVTIAEFDALVEAQADSELLELVDGNIVMMSNPTEAHEQIVGNIGARLKLAMDGKGCRTYLGGMRVQRSADTRNTDKPKPDILVRCGVAGKGSFITDPVVVVEVLSPRTIDVDRGRKLEFYKSLPTLRHIALVYQDQIRVELYHRSEAGWDLTVLTTPDAMLTFAAVAFEVGLAEAYFGVEV